MLDLVYREVLTYITLEQSKQYTLLQYIYGAIVVLELESFDCSIIQNAFIPLQGKDYEDGTHLICGKDLKNP